MITLNSDDVVHILTENELTKHYAEAYRQGQIDMKEIMDNETT